MQILLEHDEILEAIEAQVRKQISIAPDQDIEIDLKAGRGDNGFSAILSIKSKSKPNQDQEAKPEPVKAAPKPKAEPVEEPEPVKAEKAVKETKPAAPRKTGIFAKLGPVAEVADTVDADSETGDDEPEDTTEGAVDAPKPTTSIFQFNTPKPAAE